MQERDKGQTTAISQPFLGSLALLYAHETHSTGDKNVFDVRVGSVDTLADFRGLRVVVASRGASDGSLGSRERRLQRVLAAVAKRLDRRVRHCSFLWELVCEGTGNNNNEVPSVPSQKIYRSPPNLAELFGRHQRAANHDHATQMNRLAEHV